MAKRTRLRIEYVALGEIPPAPKNPKGHDIGEIILSIRRFGFVAPGIVNEATGRMVVGHGRDEALSRMRADGEDVPLNIKADGDRWLVPFVYGHSFASDEEAEAYLIADNRSGELGGWDKPGLAEMLQGFAENDVSFKGIGFDSDDLDEMLADLNPNFQPEDESTIPRLDQKTPTKCPECGHEWTP